MDKQVIINNIDVAGCEHFSVYSGNGCRCYFLENEDTVVGCENYPNCYYKQLKRKEQECEELKNELIDIKWKIEAQDIELNDNIEQLDQLKATNEDLLSIQYKLADNNKRLRQTLTEIKEIAENGKRFAERYMITGEQKANVLTYANAILQKISECEGNK